MIIKVTATESASRRTKNRINEHGNEGFIEILRKDSCETLDKQPGVFVECVHECKMSGWKGWLPLTEINIEQPPKEWGVSN